MGAARTILQRTAALLVVTASCADGDRAEPDANTSQTSDARPQQDASSSTQQDATPWCAGFEHKAHCYLVRETVANIAWVAAQEACEQEKSGAHLATFVSAEENQAVISKTKPTKRAWIGLNDRTAEGTFVWVTTEPFSYSNWRPSEPSNGGNTGNEDCVAQSIEGDDWRWNDLGCDGGAAGTFAYICEYQ